LCDSCRARDHRRYGQRRRAGLASDDRYYHSAVWRALRALQLGREPLCRRCRELGYTVTAIGVNHKIPRAQGGTDTLGNLESCCARHLNTADPRGVVARGEGESKSLERYGE
jgi:5-methylcytosine-specific restriction endonuclease McrA